MWIIGLNQARRNQWCTSNRGAILYTVGIFGFSYKDRGSERLSVWPNTQSIRSELAEQNSETEGPDYSEQLALWEVSLWKMDGFKIRQLRQPGGKADPTMEERVRAEEHCAESTLRQDQGSDHGNGEVN